MHFSVGATAGETGDSLIDLREEWCSSSPAVNEKGQLLNLIAPHIWIASNNT